MKRSSKRGYERREPTVGASRCRCLVEVVFEWRVRKDKSSARRRFCVKGLRDTAVAVNQVVPRAHALIFGDVSFLILIFSFTYTEVKNEFLQ